MSILLNCAKFSARIYDLLMHDAMALASSLHLSLLNAPLQRPISMLDMSVVAVN